MRVEQEESDQVLKHEICSVCNKPKAPHEHTEEGYICRTCILKATEIHQTWVINGRLFHKVLKPAIALVKKEVHRQ